MIRCDGGAARVAAAMRFHGWRVVAACFVIVGFANALGLFGASVYLRAVTAEHGWPVASVASAITVFFLVSAALQRAVGRGIDRSGPRPVLCVGVVALGLGVVLIGQVTLPWHLYPCFVLVGIGWASLSSTGITATLAPWFERHQGRAITLAVMGASLGAIAGVPLLLFVIGRFGLRLGLLAAGVATVVVLLPLVWRVLRFRRPEDLGQRRDGDTPIAASAQPPAAVATAGQMPGVRLWTAAGCFALAMTGQFGFITHHVALAEPLLGAAGAGWLVSATGIAALAGRLVLARMVDRWDVRRLAGAILAMQSIALLAMAIWPTVPVLVCASLAYGYGIGHVTTLAPVVVRREFGAASFGTVYGSAATLIQFSSAFGPALYGALRDGFGGYGAVLAIAAGVNLVALAILRAGRPR